MVQWNSHPIRKNRHQQSVHGWPDDIYDMPALNGKLVSNAVLIYCVSV